MFTHIASFEGGYVIRSLRGWFFKTLGDDGDYWWLICEHRWAKFSTKEKAKEFWEEYKRRERLERKKYPKPPKFVGFL